MGEETGWYEVGGRNQHSCFGKGCDPSAAESEEGVSANTHHDFEALGHGHGILHGEVREGIGDSYRGGRNLGLRRGGEHDDPEDHDYGPHGGERHPYGGGPDKEGTEEGEHRRSWRDSQYGPLDIAHVQTVEGKAEQVLHTRDDLQIDTMAVA